MLELYRVSRLFSTVNGPQTKENVNKLLVVVCRRFSFVETDQKGTRTTWFLKGAVDVVFALELRLSFDCCGTKCHPTGSCLVLTSWPE